MKKPTKIWKPNQEPTPEQYAAFVDYIQEQGLINYVVVGTIVDIDDIVWTYTDLEGKNERPAFDV